MILVTRLNGPAFAVNPDLIERAESTPDTVLTLVDGSKYVVTEPVEVLIARIVEFRAAVIATAHRLEAEGMRDHRPADRGAATAAAAGEATVLPLHRREP